MPYATEQDMVDRVGSDELIQLTDTTNSGVIDSTKVDQVLADASETIDSYIGGRYELPLQHVPPVLVRVCVEMARYKLYTVEAPKVVADAYSANVQWLTQVSNGTVRLGLDASNVAPTPSDGAQMENDGHVFSRTDQSFI